MKSWIVVSSLVWSLALIAHESPAQSAGPDAGAPATAPQPASTSSGPRVVPRSSVHLLPSKIVDDVYELRIAVPEDYDNDDELRPVIYALDGQWNFTLLSDIVGKLSYDGSIPDPIVVAITWQGGDSQSAARRWRDYTPDVVEGAPPSGGAADFMKVLETEVFPLVESTYRASRQRVLTGGSLGGLFVSYALLERPDLFDGYVASSGATDLAQEYITRRLEAIDPELLRHERAYFSVGGQYDVEPVVREFVADLEAVVGESPRIVLDVVPGVGHTGNETFGYLRGLLHAFQRPRLPLRERFLERYENVYSDPEFFPDGYELTIEAERGALYISQGGERWPEVFLAASRTHFYAEGNDLDLTFQRDDDGAFFFTLNFFRTPIEVRPR